MKRKNRIDQELDTFNKNVKEKANSEMPDKIKFTAQDLVSVVPKTKNQILFLDSYSETYKYPNNEQNSELDIIDKNFFLLGCPGTGKTFMAFAKALEEVILNKTKEKIIIIRSVVETRPRGFLPGTEEDKEAPFELPYIGICDELLKYQWKNYERLKKAGLIEFESTSNLRGTTMHDSVIIVDECQNLNFHELDTVITRVGRNSRIIFCGDFAQTDLILNKNDKSGLPEFLKIVKHMKCFETINFTAEDIVRSGLVKEYILAKNKVEISNSKSDSE